jgi:hypothetical protein
VDANGYVTGLATVPKENKSDTNWTGYWLGPRAGLWRGYWLVPRTGLCDLQKTQYQLERTLGGSKGRSVERILGGSKDLSVDRILSGSKDRPVCSTEDSITIGQDTGWVQGRVCGQDTGWVQRPVYVLNRRKNSSRS